MNTSSDSLSILLPARDAQATLAADVEWMVHAVAELTSCFELLIVDDGSIDATEEIALELAAQYAQVRRLRLPRPLGSLAALRAGLARTSGDYVLVCDGQNPPRVGAIAALWRSRHATSTPDAQPMAGVWGRLFARRLPWPSRAKLPPSGLRLMRRLELADLDPSAVGRASDRQRVRRIDAVSSVPPPVSSTARRAVK